MSEQLLMLDESNFNRINAEAPILEYILYKGDDVVYRGSVCWYIEGVVDDIAEAFDCSLSIDKYIKSDEPNEYKFGSDDGHTLVIKQRPPTDGELRYARQENVKQKAYKEGYAKGSKSSGNGRGYTDREVSILEHTHEYYKEKCKKCKERPKGESD